MGLNNLADSLTLSSSGLKAQSMRMRVIAENIANAQSTGKTAGEMPYRRKVVSFAEQLDRATGMDMVKVDKVAKDTSPFERRYQPGHPAADSAGYVLFPNVNTMIESMDMRSAQRSYEANLNVMEISRTMLMRTIDLLRA